MSVSRVCVCVCVRVRVCGTLLQTCHPCDRHSATETSRGPTLVAVTMASVFVSDRENLRDTEGALYWDTQTHTQGGHCPLSLLHSTPRLNHSHTSHQL